MDPEDVAKAARVPRLSRRALSWAALAAAMGAALPARAAGNVLRIGVQKYGTLVIMRERRTLAPILRRLGWSVTWSEFPGGPQLLEALNVGDLDFGITGEAPPVFAQAAGAPLVYVGAEPPAPTGEAILVPQNSPVHGVADLKGKRVALNKGSNVHFLLVQALKSAGLTPSDIEPVYLAPADGRAAFEQGAVDAWAIWDPYFAVGQAATQARVLVDGAGLAPNRQFFLAARGFAEGQPAILKTVLAQIAATDAWSKAHPDETVAILAPALNVPPDILKKAILRLGYGVGPMSEAAIADQQRIADTFYDLKLIPVPVSIKAALWSAPS
jgi:sulfonate transport system substrate-binding protein